jgi:branched-chain amino acid transport system permease protein
MEYFIQQLINGITLGGLYALIALGYTMVYGVIQLINFAHGEFFAAGGYVGVILLSFFTGLGYMDTHPILCLAGAFALTMGYCAFLAMGVEKVAYKPLRKPIAPGRPAQRPGHVHLPVQRADADPGGL